MPKILKNTSLKPHNTFGLDVKAAYFVEVTSAQDFKDVLQSDVAKVNEILILGGGSNVLLTKDFEGLVIKNNFSGISTEKGPNEEILVTAYSGENWHELVLFTVANGLGGLENLSLIPGTVGAAPMQNIGAYGVEIKDVFVSLDALNRETLEVETFNKEQCQFGYRESIFKHEAKGKYIILSVTFRLCKIPKLNLCYGAIKDTLAEMNISNPTIADVSNAVIAIRQSKLPDPKEIGNSGSFFKNPEISKDQYENIKKSYPNMPSYPISPEVVKVPAGWLIEQAGWKGKRFGDIGVHAKQALVLVNYGGGKGQDIANLSEEIKASVFEKFGIKLHTEVNII
jgi:UDP-N-acetylmuramate dehydrogenase